MKLSIFAPAVFAGVLVATPQAATSAVLAAFSGVNITFETFDGSQAVQSLSRTTFTLADEIEGDGVNSGGSTNVAPNLDLSQSVFTTSNRVDAESAVTVDGLASFAVRLQQEFTVARSLVEDRSVRITLEPIVGLGGLYLNAFGQSGAIGDIGSAFASITLERSDFEGVLYQDSVFQNLVGTLPGDIVNEQKNLASIFFDELIPQRDPGDPDVRFTLNLLVETFAFAQPQDVDVNVIPLPPAAPLLALGLGCILLLRWRRRDAA